MNQLICIAPDLIEDADLWAYIEGMAAESIIEHIHLCEFCQLEIQELIKTDVILKNGVFRETCPDTDTLWRYENQTLVDREKVAIHINSCAYCQQELRQIRKAIYRPSDLAEENNTLSFHSHAARKLIEAILVPKSAMTSNALRGESETQQIFQAEDSQIIISKTPLTAVADVWQIEGQIISATMSVDRLKGTIIVTKNDANVGNYEINNVGYFEVDNLKPGKYGLHFYMPSITLTITDFEIP